MATAEEGKKLMEDALEAIRREFATVRTGKATPALLDSVRVEAYGSQMPLNQVATVGTPEPSLIMVQPFDPSAANDIDRGIRESKLGFNPVNEGKVLRIPIPELTEERRKEFVKALKGMGEEARVRVRAGGR